MAVQNGYYNNASDVSDFDEQAPVYITSQAYFPPNDGAEVTVERPQFTVVRVGTTRSFLAKNASGAPLVGLNPAWLTFKNAVTNVSQVAPTFSVVGGGLYKFTMSGTNPVGIIDLGSSASPRYLVYATVSSAWCFAAFSVAGTPLAGLVPTWVSLKNISDNTDYLPQPAITELGNGLYKTDFLSTPVTGIIDLGATASPRYVNYDSNRPILLIPIYIPEG